MGMAASQARYLGLTARKTNTEYEGQQINQQRMALANQSAGLFNQMLSLQVPTPPSTQDFTTVSYAYTDGVNNETITKFSPLANDPNYNYTVTHYHNSDVYTGIETKQVNPQVRKSGVNFTYIGNSALSKISIAEEQSLATPNVVKTGSDYTSVSGYTLSAYSASTDATALDQFKTLHPGSPIDNAPTSEIFKYTDGSGVVHFVCKADLDTAYNGGGVQAALTNYVSGDTTNWAAIKQIIADNPSSQFADDIGSGADIYSYQLGGVTYYACETDLQASYDSNGQAIDGQIALNRYNAAYLNTKIETTEKAFLQQDQSGRFVSVKLQNSSPTFTLNSNTTTDENAYNDAMNQYNYNTLKYQQQVEDINAKTRIIQEQDRTLELRLKQLDTEQKALQTEMDAVKKVIDKNVETTFKTFGG